VRTRHRWSELRLEMKARYLESIETRAGGEAYEE